MAAAVAARVADGPSEIDDADRGAHQLGAMIQTG
jgi:hypothetical protein